MKPSEFHNNINTISAEEKVIAQGGTCTIYRIIIHGKYHVKKCIKEEFQQSPQYIESLRREFEIGFQLDHPNIIRYLEQHNEYLLLEYVDGQTLSGFLSKSIASKELKIRIANQLVGALIYLHSKQIYHMDLKPENIMITNKGNNVKLIDFGHAVVDGHLNKFGGTKGFSSPESEYGPHSDIFSFGKVIDILFTESEKKGHIQSVIEKCVGSNKLKYNSIDEVEIALARKRGKVVQIIAGVILTIASMILFYVIQNDAKNSVVSDNVISTKTVELFTAEDSIYCKKLGESYYETFNNAFKLSDDMNKGGELQTSLRDSIQSEWFKYSEKWNPMSKEYEKGYNLFNSAFVTSEKKIMSEIYR